MELKTDAICFGGEPEIKINKYTLGQGKIEEI